VDWLSESLSSRSVADQLRKLGQSREHFARSGRAEAPANLAVIESRLDEISRAVLASTVSMQSVVPDPDVFDRIEVRIAALARQIEALAGVGEAPVLDRLSALAERVERIAASTSSQSIGHLGGQIAALMRRLDEGGSGAGIDAARMSDLEGRLDEVL